MRPLNMRKNFTVRVTKKLWSLSHWICSRIVWTHSCFLGWPCLSMEAGPEDPLGSLPTSPGLCDSVIL